MGKRQKVRKRKSWIKKAGWPFAAASLICFGLQFEKVGALLIVVAILIAFIATEVSENPDDFWHTDDGEENSIEKGPDSVD